MSWYRGAVGEIATVERLGPEWTVLRAVPVGAGTSDIDHILIGPPGVFTFNTKNHTGQAVWVAGRTLMVTGKKQRHLYNAAHEASKAAALLTRTVGAPVPVTGVVVILAPKSLTVKAKPEGAAVVTGNRLLAWLTAQPTTLNPGQIGVIAVAAAQPGTWHRNPPAMTDPDRLRREFAALRTAVNKARARRIGWLLALIIGIPLILTTLSRHLLSVLASRSRGQVSTAKVHQRYDVAEPLNNSRPYARARNSRINCIIYTSGTEGAINADLRKVTDVCSRQVMS